MLQNIEDIKIGKRVRKDVGNIESLKESIKRYGLLNPVTINSKNELIAGRRRLEAAKMLGWTSIPVVIADIHTKADLLELELEENVQRVNFTDADLIQGYAKLKKLQNPSFFMRIWLAICDFFKKLLNLD